MSTDWFTAGNWSAGIPSAGTNTTINTTTPNAAVIGAAGAVASAITIGSTNGGSGGLTIQAGGTLASQSAILGDVSGSTGSALVTGTGSAWTMAGGLTVGRQGTGTLTINHLGTVTVGSGAGTLTIAELAGSTGTVNIGAPIAASTAVITGTLDVGTVQFGAGNGTLNFRQSSGAITFDTVLSGNGKVNIIGGRTTLTANSTGFTGTVTVGIDGALVLDGALLPNASLAIGVVPPGTGGLYLAGGDLHGTGTVGNTIIYGGSMISPGDSSSSSNNHIGTLTVNGTLSLRASNFAGYHAQLTPVSNDRIIVSGTAEIDGPLRVVAFPGASAYSPGTYTLLEAAGGRTGTFSRTFLLGDLDGLHASVSYTGTQALLNLTTAPTGTNAQWGAAPGSNLWNTAANWNGAATATSTATFGASTQTDVRFDQLTTSIGTMTFDANAPAYLFQVLGFTATGNSQLDIVGAGVVNNSTTTRPTFFVGAGGDGGEGVNFRNASSAANAIFSTFNNPGFYGIRFYDASTAATATFNHEFGYGTAFFDSSNAGTATFTYGGAAFMGSSSAANASFTITDSANGGLVFADNATASQAQIVNTNDLGYYIDSTLTQWNNSGVGGVWFTDNSTAANANIANSGRGILYLDGSSTLANATVVSTDATGLAALFGSVYFLGSSSAGASSITSNNSFVTFGETSSTGTSTIVNNGASGVQFYQSAGSGNAIITNNAGSVVRFYQFAQGPNLTIINNAGAAVEIGMDPQELPTFYSPTVTIGTLTGPGGIFLGQRQLILSGNGGGNVTLGTIADGGPWGGTGGSLVWNGAGVLTLPGDNTFTGTTTINGGGMQLGSGANSGALAGSIVLNAPLAINRTGSVTLPGVISGTAALTHSGSGTTTLTANSGGYTGNTAINAGILRINGSFAGSDVAVNPGGTLGGTGTVGPTTVAAGGTHAPGASIGTQTVLGNYVLGGTLVVEINPIASDKVIVTGDVNITGSTLEIMEETNFGWQLNQSYTIIDNQGPNAVVGQFAAVRNVYAFLAPTVSYTGDDGNNVVLSIVRNAIAFPAAGLTPNQQAAGAGAESAGPGSLIYLALVVLPAAGVPAAFDQISGELHASLKAAALEDGRFLREAVVQRTHRIFEDEDALGAWLQAYGALEQRAGDGNAAALSSSTGGLLFGADGRGSNGWYVGVAGGIGRTSLTIPDRNSSAISDDAHVTAYATGSLGGVVLRAGAGLTQHSVATTRSPAFAGFGETLTARYDATTVQLSAEAGYPVDVAGLTVEPFAGLAGIAHHAGAFAETGGAAALTAPAGTTLAAIASIGIRVSDTFVLANGMEIEAHGSLAFRQALGPTPTGTLAFAGGQPFTVASAPLPGSALTLELGAALKLNDTATLDLTYSGQFSRAAMSHAAKATLHVGF